MRLTHSDSGHIPTFLDIHLSRALDEPFTSPSSYTQIFERGIDPNVDDPTQCHDHSEVPVNIEDWPKMEDVLEYRGRVQQRLARTYKLLPSAGKTSRRLARTICMVYEHQALHLEVRRNLIPILRTQTLCYMLAQKAQDINAPRGFAVPQWDSLAKAWDAQVARDGKAAREAVIDFGPSTVTLGVNDRDFEDDKTPYDPSHVFTWDNENGVRQAQVDACRISLLPISNAQYLDFLQHSDYKAELVPASWSEDAGLKTYGVKVLPAPGVVDMRIAQHWPVLASPLQLAAFAHWKGGRLPTEPELRRFFDSDFSARPDTANSNAGLQRWHLVPCVG